MVAIPNLAEACLIEDCGPYFFLPFFLLLSSGQLLETAVKPVKGAVLKSCTLKKVSIKSVLLQWKVFWGLKAKCIQPAGVLDESHWAIYLGLFWEQTETRRCAIDYKDMKGRKPELILRALICLQQKQTGVLWHLKYSICGLRVED